MLGVVTDSDQSLFVTVVSLEKMATAKGSGFFFFLMLASNNHVKDRTGWIFLMTLSVKPDGLTKERSPFSQYYVLLK